MVEIYKTREILKTGTNQRLWITVWEGSTNITGERVIIMTTYLSDGRTYDKIIEPTTRESASVRGPKMAEAKLKLKLKKDYEEIGSVRPKHCNRRHPHIDGGSQVDPAPAPPETKYLPTLAHRWDKHSSKMTYPCIVQPKLDGIRCLYNPDKKQLQTRTGGLIVAPGILKSVSNLISVYDGELYCPNTPLQDIIHIIKSGDEKLQSDSGLGWYIFDRPSDRPYRPRLADLIAGMNFKPPVYHITSKIATCVEEVDSYYAQCIASGLEGVVVKSFDHHYEYGKRIYGMLKRKEVFDDEFKITRLVLDVIDPRFGGLASYMCVTKDGQEFKVTPAMTKEARARLYDSVEIDSVVGKMLTVEYRSVSKDGIPLCASGKGIREDT